MTFLPEDVVTHLNSWIGHTDCQSEIIQDALVSRFKATLDVDPRLAVVEPTLGIQWCLAPIAVPLSEIGKDGHARKGGFLPPVPLPRRMWAGGALQFQLPLAIGDIVRRESVIESVEHKSGRSGELLFVTISHRYLVKDGVAIIERQDIVYRPITKKKEAIVLEHADADKDGDETIFVDASSTLLFRYSALTFNSHRIHYDLTYAKKIELYEGLVVHGPLQATLALRFAAALASDATIRSFSFRGRSPLIYEQTFSIRAREKNGGLDLTVMSEDRSVTMTARADF